MANVVVITSPHAGSIEIVTNGGVPVYYCNLKNVKVSGDNPFLPDGTTLNPIATIYIQFKGDDGFELKWLLSDVTTIGGSLTPATLALAITALATLIAE